MTSRQPITRILQHLYGCFLILSPHMNTPPIIALPSTTSALSDTISSRYKDLIQIKRISWTGLIVSLFQPFAIIIFLIVCFYAWYRRNHINILVMDERFLSVLSQPDVNSISNTTKMQASFIKTHKNITLLPWKLLLLALIIRFSLIFFMAGMQTVR